jgi:hypothetical protein
MERLHQGAGGFREAAGRRYPPRDIDKVRARGETWPVDPEMREAFDRLGADLRGEIQALGTDLRGEIRSSAAETRVYVDERFEAHTASLIHELRESESRTRRHFDVVGESLRGDIRGVAEPMCQRSGWNLRGKAW